MNSHEIEGGRKLGVSVFSGNKRERKRKNGFLGLVLYAQNASMLLVNKLSQKCFNISWKITRRG